MQMHLPEIDWQPVSRIQLFCWMAFYGLLLLYLGMNWGELTLLDNIHLPIHEGGHLLFGWLGETLGLWGGTLLQLLVPAALAVSFAVRRELPGTVFCLFAFFHSLTGVATYMADALRLELPLVTVGAAADEAQHDWVRIFSSPGCSAARNSDRQLHATCGLGRNGGDAGMVCLAAIPSNRKLVPRSCLVTAQSSPPIPARSF